MVCFLGRVNLDLILYVVELFIFFFIRLLFTSIMKSCNNLLISVILLVLRLSLAN